MTPGNYECSGTHATRPLHRPKAAFKRCLKNYQKNKKTAEEITFDDARRMTYFWRRLDRLRGGPLSPRRRGCCRTSAASSYRL